MAIEWRPEFSVGNPELDHEHRELIDLVNRTAGTILEDCVGVETSKRFGDLLRAIGAHFALEERQMREARYDQLGEHKADHERLLDQLRDIMDTVDQAPGEMAQHLVATLEAWFTRHFSTYDARLHRHLGRAGG
jgi:hemerythrin